MNYLKLYSLTISCNTPTLEMVDKAKTFFEENTKITTTHAIAKKTIPAFGIRKKSKIGFYVKLWGKNAYKFLDNFSIISIKDKSINEHGIVTFGVKEYTNLKILKYNPDIPIFGFTINLRIHRPGLGIVYKTKGKSKIKSLDIQQIKQYLSNNFKNIIIK